MEHEKSEINNVAMMADLKNNMNFQRNWFDLKNQGQPSGSGNQTWIF